MIETRIDALIKAGWRVMNSDFSEKAFQEWRRQAFDCVVALCGQSHPYADYFRRGLQKARKSNLLTGVGLLTAARSAEMEVRPLKRHMNGANRLPRSSQIYFLRRQQ